MSETRGTIFNIQRFSIHDGPGIRTTVFFKGCPLSCPWCSNPESIHPYPEIMLREANCIRCGNCVKACPIGASTITDDQRVINFARCNQCLRCVEVCNARAIERMGQWSSVEEILATVMRDAGYYQSTGGGLTLSGGEPLRQWRFARELAKAARANGIHVALDTSGYASWEALSSVIQYVDLVLYDLKHIDSDLHRLHTGVPNRRILTNLEALLRDTKVSVWIRIPVIPGFNHSMEAITAIGYYLKTLDRPVEKVSLLPYHSYGAGKYPALGRAYHWPDQTTVQEEMLADFIKYLTGLQLRVEIGR